MDIRKAGWAKAVLLIEGIFAASDIEMADEYGFETVIHNERQIEWLEKAELKNTLRVHLKCNTGMNRLGFRPEAIPQVLFRLNNIPKVEVVDLLAHFANAEVTYEQDKPVTVQNQLAALIQLRGLLPSAYPTRAAFCGMKPETRLCAQVLPCTASAPTVMFLHSLWV